MGFSSYCVLSGNFPAAAAEGDTEVEACFTCDSGYHSSSSLFGNYLRVPRATSFLVAEIQGTRVHRPEPRREAEI